MKRALLQSFVSIIIACCAYCVEAQSAHGQDLPPFNPAGDVSVREGFSGVILFDYEKPDQSKQLRLIDLDTSTALQPLDAAGQDSSATGHQEGILSIKKTAGRNELWWHRTDGSTQQVYQTPVDISGATWSEVQGTLIFSRSIAGNRSALFQASTYLPFEATQLTYFLGENTTPNINPVTGEIAYSTSRQFPGWDICIFDPYTKRDSCILGNNSLSFCRPAWSPNGEELVYSKGQFEEIDLYILNRNTNVSRRLTSLPYKEYDATWSPDGQYIAFAHNPNGGSRYEIKVVRIRDGQVAVLASGIGSMRGLSWIPRKNYLLIPSPGCSAGSLKTNPGICGCAVMDADSDYDGTPDCIDQCPADPQKQVPGACGCGQLEQESCTAVVPEVSTLSAPVISKRRISPGRYQIAVSLSGRSASGQYFLKIQQGNSYRIKSFRIDKNKKQSRKFSMVVTKPSMVRVAARKRSEEAFSLWSRWISVAMRAE